MARATAGRKACVERVRKHVEPWLGTVRMQQERRTAPRTWKKAEKSRTGYDTKQAKAKASSLNKAQGG